MKIASVDIGTNAVKSKIFKTTPTSIKYIDGIRSPIRLGSDVFKKGKISEKKLDELSKTLQKYQRKFKKDKIDQYEIVATSALRNSSNSEDVRRSIENKIEHPIRIISGLEEGNIILIESQVVSSTVETSTEKEKESESLQRPNINRIR